MKLGLPALPRVSFLKIFPPGCNLAEIFFPPTPPGVGGENKFISL